MAYKDLENYAVIGNLETCALVCSDASVDWLCLPWLESSSVFAAILDDERGGRYSIAPKWHYDSSQEYIENSNVVRTVFKSASGRAILTDFMPLKGVTRRTHRALYRKVECQVGTIAMQVRFEPRFEYGKVQPVFEKFQGGLVAETDQQKLFLFCPTEFEATEKGLFSYFTLRGGESLWFILQYQDDTPTTRDDCELELSHTIEWWRNWAAQREEYTEVFHEPYRHLAIRSGLTLKLLEDGAGGISASATMSIPQEIGGIRNWDYRYAWIRDLSFTVQALYHLGHLEEADNFHEWLKKTLRKAETPAGLKPIVPLREDMSMSEAILDNLLGYKHSAPVRCGNKAASQKQHDIYGELVGALYDITRYGAHLDQQEWHLISCVVDYVCKIWKEPDSGIWEIRQEPRHHVHSKLLCWMTVDRGIRIAQSRNFSAPLERWKRERERIRKAILERGFNERLNSFVSSFDSETLDASNLTIAATEFLPPDHPKVVGTIEAVRKHLEIGGLVRPYNEDDGLAGSMQGFYLCSFFLVKALAMMGKTEEAEEVLSNCLQYASPLGLLSEQVDMTTGKLCGNFPQAFSHIGLINSTLYLGIAEGHHYEGPSPVGLP